MARVIFAAQHVHFGKIEEAVQACETEGVEAWIAADFFQTAIARPTFDVLGGRLMLVFHTTPQVSWALAVQGHAGPCRRRRAAGAVAAPLAGRHRWHPPHLAWPDFLSAGTRGHYGQPFMMWKFRTMHVDAEAQRAQLETQQ